jgi:hypothetical protein
MTPDDGDFAVWQMWCIERERLHVLTPRKDKIKVINSIDMTGDSNEK